MPKRVPIGIGGLLILPHGELGIAMQLQGGSEIVVDPFAAFFLRLFVEFISITRQRLIQLPARGLESFKGLT